MVTVSIHFETDTDDTAEVDRLSRDLSRELFQGDVEDVEFAREGEAPTGAKGDPVSVGMLIVSLANSAGLVGVCQVVRSWVSRDERRRIVVRAGKRTLEITGASPQQHQQIIDAFLQEEKPKSEKEG